MRLLNYRPERAFFSFFFLQLRRRMAPAPDSPLRAIGWFACWLAGWLGGWLVCWLLLR